LGFVNFVVAFSFFQSNYQAVFYIGIVILVIFTIPTLIFAKEIPLDVLEKAATPVYTDEGNTPSPTPREDDKPKETFLTVLKNMGVHHARSFAT